MKVLRLRIPPLPHFARTARRTFAKFVGLHGLDGWETQSLVFALGEAVANAIQHAGSRQAIEIRVRVAGDSVVTTVKDRGCGIAAPPSGRVALPSVFAEAGRGFAIMQRFTDFLEVNTRAGHGTVVKFGRYRRDTLG